MALPYYASREHFFLKKCNEEDRIVNSIKSTIKIRELIPIILVYILEIKRVIRRLCVKLGTMNNMKGMLQASLEMLQR